VFLDYIVVDEQDTLARGARQQLANKRPAPYRERQAKSASLKRRKKENRVNKRYGTCSH